MFASALVITSACVEMPETGIVPQVGKEVQFGLSLGDGVKTRTVYGEETETGFPVYWANGDQVLIASPQCLDGRNSARYEVSCSTSVQSTADALSKVDDAGIQWGDVDNGDVVRFYSIYPAQGNKLVVNNGDIEASLKVASTQYAKISSSKDGSAIYAQPADMGNVIMYASAAGEYGETVSLTYRPFSTVIEFTTQTPGFGAGNQPLTIQSLTLTAPTNGPVIAGDFKFNFNGPSIDPINETGSKSITVHFLENNEYTLKVDKQQLIKIKMCVMPTDKIKSLEGWKVVLATSAGNFTKTLSSEDLGEKKTELAPGKVHKIVLPPLEFADTEWVYSSTNWITSIPDYKKVYLTELSLPGAWYALHDNDDKYQFSSNPEKISNISDLWNAGVRAFAIETKTTAKASSIGTAQDSPIGVILSGTGSNSSEKWAGGYNSLHTSKGENGKVYKGGIRISEIIAAVANAISTDEFGVLVLSYADGGNSGNRYVDYGAWLNLLYKEIQNSGVTGKIFTGTMDQNTTIEQVLNKLIIKVNIDENIACSGGVNNITQFPFPTDLPALYSYTPYIEQLDGANFGDIHYSKLHWMKWEDKVTNFRETYATIGSQSDFMWCFSSANRTAVSNNPDIPTYTQRQEALERMIIQSKAIYDKSNHNVWFYFNCGGTEAEGLSGNGNALNFASKMNQWLLEKINAKTDASPLGIVMFNQCTGDNNTYHGKDIIQAIIEMNSKFYLRHEGDYDFERPVSAFDDSSLGVDAWGTDFIQ